ncbi:MAG: fused MFS/spermidine synthase [Candidatus Melainabacteria bacterium]|nr:fused MFS/spermidine synthase [Candidatus Melainabacteria bacterium]
MLFLYSTTVFVSGLLLFWIQPMFAKMILPVLGSAPAVWNTCVVFFQAVLLLGYIYAHVSIKFLGVQKQSIFHILLLFLPFFVLPVCIPKGWTPPVGENPILWLLLLLSFSVGLPFFIISTSVPMLQKWFSLLGHKTSSDPYFLYVSSNFGSMIGLLSYPIVIEPYLKLVNQSILWSLGYFLLVLLVICCAFTLHFKRANITSPSTTYTEISEDRETPSSTKFKWIILAFIPSSLLLGVTTYLTSEVPAIPLFWIIPLVIYLLTFILVFSRKELISHKLMVKVMPYVILLLAAFLIFDIGKSTYLFNLIHLLMFFVASMVCHGELAKTRPATKYLTEFYLLISLGGVLGGMFNALVAPLLFNRIIEYPLAIVLACLVCLHLTKANLLDYVLPLLIGLIIFILIKVLPLLSLKISILKIIFAIILPIIICFFFSKRPVRLILSVAILLIASVYYKYCEQEVLFIERSFFGIHTVKYGSGKKFHSLLHGSTLHGCQRINPLKQKEPLAYYSYTSPIGQVFKNFENINDAWHVALIGLGTGSIASYAKPEQVWMFYEIDPTVKRIATNPKYFTYLQNCLAKHEIVLGDGRLSIKKAKNSFFNLIIIDGFASDCIPVHLITKEALELYLSKLSKSGILAFHITNRFLSLEPILGNLADSLGLICLAQIDNNQLQRSSGKYPSHWVVLARNKSDLGRLTYEKKWHFVYKRNNIPVWTDDFSNIFGVFKWIKI